jgi:phage FluMu protein gp41
MQTLTKIDETEKLIFISVDKIKEDISNKKITDLSIQNFEVLSKNFKEIGDFFFHQFEGKLEDQIITYGSAMSSSEICLLLRDNLADAKSIEQNPIAAERILSRNYLMFLQFILNSFKNIKKTSKISREDLNTINESVRSLVRLTEEDGIYQEPELKFKNNESQEILFALLKDSKTLIFSDNDSSFCRT